MSSQDAPREVGDFWSVRTSPSSSSGGNASDKSSHGSHHLPEDAEDVERSQRRQSLCSSPVDDNTAAVTEAVHYSLSHTLHGVILRSPSMSAIFTAENSMQEPPPQQQQQQQHPCTMITTPPPSSGMMMTGVVEHTPAPQPGLSATSATPTHPSSDHQRSASAGGSAKVTPAAVGPQQEVSSLPSRSAVAAAAPVSAMWTPPPASQLGPTASRCRSSSTSHIADAAAVLIPSLRLSQSAAGFHDNDAQRAGGSVEAQRGLSHPADITTWRASPPTSPSSTTSAAPAAHHHSGEEQLSRRDSKGSGSSIRLSCSTTGEQSPSSSASDSALHDDASNELMDDVMTHLLNGGDGDDHQQHPCHYGHTPRRESPVPVTPSSRRAQSNVSRLDNEDERLHPRPLLPTPLRPTPIKATPGRSQHHTDGNVTLAEAAMRSPPPLVPTDSAPRHSGAALPKKRGRKAKVQTGGWSTDGAHPHASDRSTGAAAHRRCPHAEAPDRLRLTPSLTCAACAYSVCCACFALGDAAQAVIVPLFTQSLPPAASVSEGKAKAMSAHALTESLVTYLQLQAKRNDADGAAVGDFKCHICKQPHGHLTFDDVAPFPWSCEGLYPVHRMSLKGGGMYAQAAVQKYYQIRSIRDARGKVPLAQLSVTWVGRCPANGVRADCDVGGEVSATQCQSLTTVRVGGCIDARHRFIDAHKRLFVLAGGDASSSPPPTWRRRQCVVEGSSFFVTLNNPSRATKLLWCVRRSIPRSELLHNPHERGGLVTSAAPDSVQHPHAVARTPTPSSGTTSVCNVGALVPLAVWSVPPTVEGVVAPRDVRAAAGAARNTSAKRPSSSSSRHAQDDGVAVSPWVYEVAVPDGFWEATGGGGLLELYHYDNGGESGADVASGNGTGGGVEHANPLNSFETNTRRSSRLAQRAAVGTPQRHQLPMDPILVIEVLHVTRRGVSSSSSGAATAAASTPLEAAFALDVLRHGRDVGIYGVGSKYAFLQHVSRSAQLSSTRIHVVDCLQLSSVGGARGGGGGDKLVQDIHAIETRIRELQRQAALHAQRMQSAAMKSTARRMGTPKRSAPEVTEVIDLTEGDDGAPGGSQQFGTINLVEDSLPTTTLTQLHGGSQPPASHGVQMTPLPTSATHVDSRPPQLSPPPRFTWSQTLAPEAPEPVAVVGASRKRGREVDDNTRHVSPPPTDGCPGGLQADLPNSYGFHLAPFLRAAASTSPMFTSSTALHTQRHGRAGAFPFAVPLHLLRAAQANSAPESTRATALFPSCETLVPSHQQCRDDSDDSPSVRDLLVIHHLDRLLSSSSSVTRRTDSDGGGGASTACRLPFFSELTKMLQRLNSFTESDGGGGGVRLLFSFDDPEFLVNAPRDFLDECRPLALQLQSPLWLLPRTTELVVCHWSAPRRSTVPLVHALSAAIGNSGVAGGGGGGAGGSGGGHRRHGLPLSDTVRRVILSLPEAFRQLLQLTVKRQREAGEEVYMPVSLLLEYFQSEANLFVSQGRMRPFLQELTSNRIALYEASRHAVMILQHHLVSQVLDDVLLKGDGSGGQAATAH